MNGYMITEDRIVMHVLSNIKTINRNSKYIEYGNSKMSEIDLDTIIVTDLVYTLGDQVPEGAADMKQTFESEQKLSNDLQNQKDIADLTLQLVMKGVL